MHRSIFAWKNNRQIPPTYTCLRMMLASLKRIGIDPDDTLILAVDGRNSWRKDIDSCLIEDTECLTENGWKLIKDIVEKKEKIKIATLNPKTNKVEYKYPTDYHRFYYKGKLHCFGGKNCRTDIIMTPEHNHYVKKQHQKKYHLIKVKNINRQGEIEHNRKFNYNKKGLKYFIIPKIKTKSIIHRKGVKFSYMIEYSEKKIDMNLWLKFLGWYLSEGSCGGRRYCGHIKPYTVIIPQSIIHNPEQCKEIEIILSKFGSVSKQKRTNIINYIISNTQLARFLKQTFGTSFHKFIPRQLLNKLSKNQCQLLLKTLIKGDGTIKKTKNSESYAYTTVSKQLANDIQELAFKAGYASTITYPTTNRKWYGLSITKNFTPRNRKHEYRGNKWNGKGLTYDLTVPNHIFFVRRNGKCCWTGNCYKANRKAYRQSHEEIDWKLMFRDFNELLYNLEKTSPFNIIKLDRMEADDIIAVACKYYKNNECIIVSYDKDYEQLCSLVNVKIFSPLVKMGAKRGGYKIIKNPWLVLAKKIDKEESDNLVNPILSEKDYDKRKMIVDLVDLPDFVIDAITPYLEKISNKEYNLNQMPFKTIREQFSSIYNSNNIVTYEDCIAYEEKKKLKKKKAKEKKNESKKKRKSNRKWYS